MIARDSPDPLRTPAAFSLVEVVIAIGICAIAVIGVVALVGPMSRAIAGVGDARAASRVIGAVQSGLQATPFSTVGSYLANRDLLYASRDGERFGPYLSPIWNDLGASQTARDRAKFFEIKLLPNDTLVAPPGAVIFTLRLRWPAYSADGTRVGDDAPSDVILIPAAVSR